MLETCVAIKEKTENTISKLQAQEKDDERRIIELENSVDLMVRVWDQDGPNQ